MIAALVGMTRFSGAYAWVAHTSDVRLVIGRAIGHAGTATSCDGLRDDLQELGALTRDNPTQQARLPELRASVELACAGRPAPNLIVELSELDATERDLMMVRRVRLADTREWSGIALVVAMLSAIAAVTITHVRQQRALRDLAISEDRFRLLASSATDLIRIHDPTGRPTYVSPSVERLLGYTPDELLAEAPLVLGPPDDLALMQRTLADIQRPHTPSTTLRYRLRARSGSYRWFETHTNPVRDRDGTLLRFYTTARDITERVELEEKLEQTAVTDELTGLFNRRSFLLIAGQEYRVAVRSQHGVAVVFADLDGLKRINDELGHDAGDRAIRQLAEVLRVTLRESDVVARLGGDEFAALVYNVDQASLEIMVVRLKAATAKQPAIGPYPLAFSLGVALLVPGETHSLADLLAQADERMYENKRARKRDLVCPPRGQHSPDTHPFLDRLSAHEAVSVLKIVTLVVNVAMAGYLIGRLRAERSHAGGHAPAR